MPVGIDSRSAPQGPKLSYPFHAFSTNSSANLTVYVGTGLNTNPERPLRYAVSLDDAMPQVVQSVPTYFLGTLPATWTQGGSASVYMNTSCVAVTPGAHTLNLWLLEPGLVVQKMVLDMRAMRPSFLGPPESMKV